TAPDRADVDDSGLVAVRGASLPLWDPLLDGVQDGAHAQDRVLLGASAAERGVDERPACRQPHPDRAVVAEHDPLLGRLAEDAHVGDAAVRDQMARAGRVAAVLLAAELLAPLRLLDLAD